MSSSDFFIERGKTMNYDKIAVEIIDLVGGKDNIIGGTHCVTRVRLNLKNEKLVNSEQINNLDGVIDTRFQSGQFQIILGSNVLKVYEALSQKVDLNSETNASKKDTKLIDKIIDTIASIFTPILPAIIGAGVMKGILAILLTAKVLNETDGTYQILNIISDAAFYFMPFLLAVSASKRFKVNEYLGVALAGVLLYPTLVNAEQAISFFKIFKVPVVTYSGSVIPIILGVWLLSVVYKQFEKIIPKTLRIIFLPVISMLITVPILLILLGPLGDYIGGFLSIIFTYLFTEMPIVAGLLIGFVYPLIIMTGMHYAYFPVLIQNFGTLGFDFGWLPIGLFSNIAQAGAVFAVALKTKNKEFRGVAISSGISALLGITEPALYGVCLKLKKPLYAVMISGSLVSAVVLSFGLKYYGMVTPGLIALPVTIDETGLTGNFMIALLGVIASFLLGFFITMFLKFDDIENKQEVKQVERVQHENNLDKLSLTISSPVTGKVISLSKVSDKIFSDKLLGEGIAIIPKDEEIFAPEDGIVTVITKSKHAIGLTLDNSVELLIHVGLDTVSMEGKGFELFVQQDQKVKKGDLLLKFNKKEIALAGHSDVIPIVVTNTSQFLDVSADVEEDVLVGDNILTII